MKRFLKVFICILLTLTTAIMPSLYSGAEKISKAGMLFDTFESIPAESFTITEKSRIFVVSDTLPTGDTAEIAELIASQFGTLDIFGGTAPEIAYGPENYAKEGDILLKNDLSITAAEAYIITVGEKAVISANDERGFIYGAGSFMKLLGNNTSIQGFRAENTPDTKQRVVMLDTGRKYFTAEWIKNFIMQMSWMGYNAIELHFSEDGGFRADFWEKNCYGDANGDGIAYSPENDFSWICGSHVQSWVKDPYRNDPDKDKYLTTAELIEICEVAKQYRIDIIPSFDSPAHMDYLTWKFEQHFKAGAPFYKYAFVYDGKTYYAKDVNGCINYMGTTGASSPTYPNYTTIDITNATAKAFVFALYADIADFFKEFAGSTDFSIGADEVNLSKSGVKWKYEKFPGYINDLNRMLNARGYTCRVFNDFIGSASYNKENGKAKYKFDENIEILYWTTNFNQTSGKPNSSIWPAEFFWETDTSGIRDHGDGGRIVYNCIGANCYYVLRVAAKTTGFPNMDARNPENRNWSFYASTEEYIYNNWYPADMISKGVHIGPESIVPEESLGGGYFLIWNDYAALNTEAEIWYGVKDNTGTSNYFYSLFDRMWSNTVKMWNQDINKTLSFTDYAEIRNGFGYFPGFTACNKSASLPEAGTIKRAYLADHTALEAALNSFISNEQRIYTDDSYAVYTAAYEAAKELNSDYGATEEQINAAIDAISSAAEMLILREFAEAEIFGIKKTSRVTPLGKKAGLVITTAAEAKAITLTLDGKEITPDESLSQLQTIDNAQRRVWYITFTPDEAGTYEYTVTSNNLISETVSITVR